MKTIEEKICYWHERARDNYYGEKARGSESYKECICCNGKDKECRRYYGITKTWNMKQDTRAYEKSHPRYGK